MRRSTYAFSLVHAISASVEPSARLMSTYPSLDFASHSLRNSTKPASVKNTRYMSFLKNLE